MTFSTPVNQFTGSVLRLFPVRVFLAAIVDISYGGVIPPSALLDHLTISVLRMPVIRTVSQLASLSAEVRSVIFGVPGSVLT